jgi:hypothetical protein
MYHNICDRPDMKVYISLREAPEMKYHTPQVHGVSGFHISQGQDINRVNPRRQRQEVHPHGLTSRRT